MTIKQKLQDLVSQITTFIENNPAPHNTPSNLNEMIDNFSKSISDASKKQNVDLSKTYFALDDEAKLHTLHPFDSQEDASEEAYQMALSHDNDCGALIFVIPASESTNDSSSSIFLNNAFSCSTDYGKESGTELYLLDNYKITSSEPSDGSQSLSFDSGSITQWIEVINNAGIQSPSNPDQSVSNSPFNRDF